jgi:hypothetical protein
MKKILITLLIIFSYSQLSFASSNDGIDLSNSHFTWGADIGGSIDMSENEQSSVNLEINGGYKNSWVNLVGIGVGMNMVVGNSNRMFPIYGIFRSSFSQQPQLCFLDLRLGASINYLEQNVNQTGFYGSAGIGFNLASSRHFKTHIILSYNYLDRGYFIKDEIVYPQHDLHMVSLRLGVNF